jgi:hypothetical protein
VAADACDEVPSPVPGIDEFSDSLSMRTLFVFFPSPTLGGVRAATVESGFVSCVAVMPACTFHQNQNEWTLQNIHLVAP